jgi:hypothetical protein
MLVTSRRSRAGSLLRLGVATALLLGIGTLRSSAVEDPDYPGLPAPEGLGGYIVPRATGTTYAAAARQWLRVPDIQAIVRSYPGQFLVDGSCRRLDPYTSITRFSASLFLVSSPGSPEPYGFHGPFTVRTVAFGAIPVEAEVRLRQVRDAENLPVAFAARQEAREFCAGKGPHAGPTDIEGHFAETSATGQLQVEISALRVDGVDLGLRPDCLAVRPSELDLTAPDYLSLDPAHRPGDAPNVEGNLYTTPYFAFSFGGLLTGTMDIPSFAGCVTSSGEDVSALVSAAVSGPGNTVRLRAEALTGNAEFVPCAKDHSCPPLDLLPLPTGPLDAPAARGR